ncbi:MAG: hypothetical protein CMN54_09230 [SAR324 cluster bacterium]|uniref:Uncharacterized protein n=1 Tax=SAR324 cluster bacterium TaxID=2024889 RepID=A0A2D6YK77_9DELT|nr:hypothetical protein [SAR324 cluster bacterium]
MKIYFANSPCFKVAIKWVKMVVIKCVVIANTRKNLRALRKNWRIKSFFLFCFFPNQIIANF